MDTLRDSIADTLRDSLVDTLRDSSADTLGDSLADTLRDSLADSQTTKGVRIPPPLGAYLVEKTVSRLPKRRDL